MAQETVQDQIKWLQGQLEAKQRELAAGGGEQKETREAMREVIRDVAQETIAPPPALTSSSAPAALPSNDDSDEAKHKDIVENLVQFALSKDLFGAIKHANALKNPHLLDDFHDQLAEHVDTLITTKKIKA